MKRVTDVVMIAIVVRMAVTAVREAIATAKVVAAVMMETAAKGMYVMTMDVAVTALVTMGMIERI